MREALPYALDASFENIEKPPAQGRGFFHRAGSPSLNGTSGKSTLWLDRKHLGELVQVPRPQRFGRGIQTINGFRWPDCSSRAVVKSLVHQRGQFRPLLCSTAQRSILLCHWVTP